MFLSSRLVVALAIASATAAILPGRPFTAIAAANLLILAGGVLDVIAAGDARGLVRGREHDEVISAEHPAEVTIRLEAGRRARIVVRDAVPPSMRPEPQRIAATLGRGSARLAYRVRPTRRGRFTLGPLSVRVHGPLGLAGRQRTVDLRTIIKVYPALRGRQQVEDRLRRGRVLEVGSRSARVRGGGLEFDSLREYHPDDEFRRINWAATSRAGKPIANVHREERNQQVLLLLDAGRTMAGTVSAAPRFEHALDAAVALATLATYVGDRVGAFAFVERIVAHVSPRGDTAQVRRIVDAMFDVEPQVEAADYLGTIGTVLQRLQRRAFLVLFTDLADEAALDPLLRTIPILTRRHLVVAAQVTDPEVRRLSRIIPTSAPEAYLKAAAAATEDRRERAARRLVQLGAAVVDRVPGELASTLADEYLRAKAYGRL